MQHLDEGTIHSWIDGQVDAEQAREIEAHVAQCAACSAAVAEARGLVAASSRILTALDDVPGGVVPKRAVPPAVRPARRQWRAAAWVTGIAAALVLAIGVNQLDRNEPVAMLDQELSDMRRDAARQALQPPTATDSTAVAPATQLIANQVAQPQPARTQQAQPPRVVAARRDSGPSRASDASAAVATDVATLGAAAGGQSMKVVAAPSAPAPVAAEALTEQRAERAAAKSTLEAVVPTAAFDSRGRLAANELEPTRFAGCYRLDPAADRRTMERVSAVAGAAARSVAQSRGARAPAAAAAAPDAPMPAPPAIVRLDTVRQPLGYVVRNATSDASVGTWRSVGDSARVDLLAAGLFNVGPRNRVACPER